MVKQLDGSPAAAGEDQNVVEDEGLKQVRKRLLSEAPTVHETAMISDSQLGQWTQIGAMTHMSETVFGDYSYAVDQCQIIYSEIGKFCSIASHVRINPGNHPMERATLHHFTYRSRMFELDEKDDAAFFDWRRSHKVIIGNDVWLGHGVIVLPGVTIGDGAAIGAGAVVSRDIPPYSVAVGVPARVMRRRFDEETEAGLLKLMWWDWSHEELKAALPDFQTLTAEEFVKKYQSKI